MREHGASMGLLVPLDTVQSCIDPVGQSKVDGFIDVEAVVEARVIRSRLTTYLRNCKT